MHWEYGKCCIIPDNIDYVIIVGRVMITHTATPISPTYQEEWSQRHYLFTDTGNHAAFQYIFHGFDPMFSHPAICSNLSNNQQ